MNDTNTLFHELIRVAIGTQTSLSRFPTEAEWENLFEMAVKQSLVGVCFVGLNRLGADSGDGFARIGMSEMLYLNWMGTAAQINMKNELVNQQCVELQKRLAADEFRSSILKGQGVAALYGEELRGFRQSGDIDVYVDCGREKAIEYARSVQGDVDWDYKHLHLNVFEDTAVEMHYVPEVFLNLRKNRKLQKWFAANSEGLWFRDDGLGITTPSVEFNLFYILLHTYRHFLYEGVGMRQLMDYFFVLQTNGSKGKEGIESKERVLTVIKQFGMTRFVKGVMWIMKEVFGISEQLLLVDPDEKEGRYILSEVMTGGNFGKHDERLSKASSKLDTVMNVCRHNLHLIYHYPLDACMSPLWFIYHKCWKYLNRK